jgi:Gly-Xaa carboxypeptidase
MSISNEKESILPSTGPRAPRQPILQKLKHDYHSKFLLVLIAYMAVLVYKGYKRVDTFRIGDNVPRCPQADILTPEKNAKLWNELNEKIGTSAFEASAINWLAGAVRVPSVDFSFSLGFHGDGLG